MKSPQFCIRSPLNLKPASIIFADTFSDFFFFSLHLTSGAFCVILSMVGKPRLSPSNARECARLAGFSLSYYNTRARECQDKYRHLFENNSRIVFWRNFFEGVFPLFTYKIQKLTVFPQCGCGQRAPKQSGKPTRRRWAGRENKARPRAGMVSRARVRGRAAASRNKGRVGAAAEREGERVSAKES